MEDELVYPEWSKDDPKAGAEELFKWVTSKTSQQIEWYEQRRKSKKLGSLLTRVVALLCAGFGALCPLTAPLAAPLKSSLSDVLGLWSGIMIDNLPELGYIFLALGGMMATFDRMYGFSSSWMRYAATQLELESSLRNFQLDWALMHAGKAEPATLIRKLKEFSTHVHSVVRKETETWVSEFRSNISEIEKALKTGREERKPGSIKLKVSNAREFKKVEVLLNNESRRALEGVSEALIDPVPPGHHELLLIGTDFTDREHRETRVAAVTADTTAAIDVQIPLVPAPA